MMFGASIKRVPRRVRVSLLSASCWSLVRSRPTVLAPARRLRADIVGIVGIVLGIIDIIVFVIIIVASSARNGTG